MPWKASLVALLPLCAQTLQPPPAAPRWQVSDLTAAALERNRELTALRARVDEARGELRQAAVRPAPSLQVGASSGAGLGSPGKEEYSAGLTQQLEAAGKRSGRLRVAEYTLRLASAELSARGRQLAIEIRLKAAEALAGQAQLTELARLSDSLVESLALLDARVARGDAAPLERQLLQVELSRLHARQRLAEGRLAADTAALRQLCGLSPNEPLLLAADPWPEPQDNAPPDLLRAALAQRPDLLLARLEEERASAGASLASAQARPDLTLSAQYSLRNERFSDLYASTASGQLAALRDRDHIVSLGVSLPLFTRRNSTGLLEAAAARTRSAAALRAHLEAAIPLELHSAWQLFQSARAASRLLNSEVLQQSEQNLSVIRQAYRLGQLRLLDVLNEQRQLLESKLAAIEAQAAMRRALAELERALGGDLQ